MGSTSSVPETSDFGVFTTTEEIADHYPNSCNGKHIIITGLFTYVTTGYF
jgi:hypothetical protein